MVKKRSYDRACRVGAPCRVRKLFRFGPCRVRATLKIKIKIKGGRGVICGKHGNIPTILIYDRIDSFIYSLVSSIYLYFFPFLIITIAPGEKKILIIFTFVFY